MFSDVGTEIVVVALSYSRHLVFFEHALIDKAIVVEKSADTVHLILVVNLAVVNMVLLRDPDEISFKIRVEVGIKFLVIFWRQLCRILVISCCEFQVLYEPADLRQQARFLKQELSLRKQLFEPPHRWHIKHRIKFPEYFLLEIRGLF